LVWLGLAGVTGCGGQEPVRSYDVPKPDVVYAENHVEPGASNSRTDTAVQEPREPTDRMLGAVVPHGDTTWYFKMTGPTAAVAKQVSKFRDLIQSLTFDGTGKPVWKLPTGWQEKPGAGQRLATLSVNVDGQSLELSIIPMPTSASSQSLLDNINRWRRQMGRETLAAEQLDKQTVKLQLADGTATLINFAGRFGSSMGNRSSLSSSLAPAAPAPGDLKYTLPDGWFESKQDTFSRAAFGVRDGDQTARVTISLLGGDGGGLLANINRWRAQASLPGISAETLKKQVQTVAVDGVSGSYMEALPAGASPAGMAVIGWIGGQADHSWFVKMRGNAPLVLQQKANFRKFLESLQFPAR